MTQIIGKLTNSSTPGEKQIYRYLEMLLEQEDEIICYYNPIIDDIRPDFLLIGKNFGICILEMKDYSPLQFKGLSDTGKWRAIYTDCEKILRNPFVQLGNYWTTIINRLDVNQIISNNKIPIHQLVIFNNISRNKANGKNIQGVRPLKCNVLFKEDIFKFEKFRENFFISINENKNIKLTNNEIKFIRANIINYSRLPDSNQSSILDFIPLDSEKILRLLDHRQEKFAYNIGEGHRLIFGVAGSGKTVVLIARARYLAYKNTEWRILVLCYNKLLANYLQKLFNPQDYKGEIFVSNFHSWARKLITSKGAKYKSMYNQEWDIAKKTQDTKDKFFQETVPRLLNMVIEETDYRHYDAILIDEAQDFEENWFSTIRKLLNPQTNSLLITCDGLQGIYARKRFFWKDVGIKAKGRVTKFTKTYRNPENIGKVAYNFLIKDSEFLKLVKNEDDFLETREFERKGGTFEIILNKDRQEAYVEILSKILIFLKKKWSILILFTRNTDIFENKHKILQLMDDTDIEWNNLKKTSLGKQGVYIGTLQGTKGLETDVVIIPDVDLIYPYIDNRQLLYVGMTRALNALVISASKENEFIRDLEILNKNIINQEENNTLKCLICGKTNKIKAKYCNNCGRELKNEKLSKFCIKCGKRIDEDNNLCNECQIID